MEKKLYKNPRDKKICGVCSGLAKYISVDVTIVRLIWAIVALCTLGIALLAYIICVVIMPDEPSDIIDVEKKESTEDA